MKKTPYFIFGVVIIILAAVLRFYNFAHRAPFDWDQNRDYQAVTQLASGKFTLIGPVAKGEGGFFLGPLYYYLLLPGYIVSHGALTSLPITSILFDLVAISLMLFLGYFLRALPMGLFLSLLWSFSPAVISSALISWNVALLPLWLIGLILLLSQRQFTQRTTFLLGLMLGLSWHIHAVLIPLAVLLFLAGWYWRAQSFIAPTMVWLVLGYLLALSPLIIFDIRHLGLQSTLIRNMLTDQLGQVTSSTAMFTSIVSRYGKNISALFGGPSDLNPLLGILGLGVSLVSLFARNILLRLSSFIILINLVLVYLLGEPTFPEYYLLSATIGLCLVLSIYLAKLKWSWLIYLVVSLQLLRAYSPAPNPYSLGYKITVAKMISSTKDANVIYDLSFGRESGIKTLLVQLGHTPNPASKITYLISEKTDMTLYINGEIAQEVGQYGAYRLAKYVVQ